MQSVTVRIRKPHIALPVALEFLGIEIKRRREYNGNWTAYLALGTNVGDRVTNLRKACKLLEYHPEIKVAARSKIYETQSVEGGGKMIF